MTDIARNETVPGANDNLSACALIVAMAEMLRDEPVEGLDVWLVSCGAEETLQDGVRGFMARHADELPPQSTFFLVPDTVGSPAAGDARGRGADVDGGVRGSPSTATRSPRARARRASSWSGGCAPARPPTRSFPAAPAIPPPRSPR